MKTELNLSELNRNKYEYKYVYNKDGIGEPRKWNNDSEQLEALNRMGSKGWELIETQSRVWDNDNIKILTEDRDQTEYLRVQKEYSFERYLFKRRII